MKEDIIYSDAKIRRKTFLSFGVFIALGAAATKGWFYLKNLPLDHGLVGGVQEPVRKVLDFNETVFNKTLSPGHLAKTYPVADAVKKPRVNGDAGLGDDFDARELYDTLKKVDTSLNPTKLNLAIALLYNSGLVENSRTPRRFALPYSVRTLVKSP